MPTLTNNLGLPEPLVEAVRRDDYDRGDCDFTVTELLDPPRKAVLEHIHDDEITEDVSERLYALMGKAMHKILEEARVADFGEARLYMTVNGARISGKPDHHSLADTVLSDWKLASVWEYIMGTRVEREQQLNCYAELLRQNGYTVSALQNVMVFRDWSKTRAQREADFPQTQVKVVRQPIWRARAVQDFLADRIQQRLAAGIELPECTAEERWARDPVWAVMKNGRKRALRLLKSETEAKRWRADNAPGARIDHRPGESVRCMAYCAAAPFCSQWKAIQEAVPDEGQILEAQLRASIEALQ